MTEKKAAKSATASKPDARTPDDVQPGDVRPDDDGSAEARGSITAEFPDVAELSYEAARDELTTIVASLEGGQVPLEESMRQWRRGEALAAHCAAWLDGAQRQITEAEPVPGRS